jgi:hypothetical protein
MRKILFVIFIIIVITIYLFLFLGIELDLKSVIERWSVEDNQLINTSFKIRQFTSIQLLLFLIISVSCVYMIIKSPNKHTCRK